MLLVLIMHSTYIAQVPQEIHVFTIIAWCYNYLSKSRVVLSVDAIEAISSKS